MVLPLREDNLTVLNIIVTACANQDHRTAVYVCGIHADISQQQKRLVTVGHFRYIKIQLDSEA